MEASKTPHKSDKNRYKDGRFAENNTAHEKWSPEVVKKFLGRMIKRLKKDEEIYTLVGLAAREGIYYDWFAQMQRKFADYTEIAEMLATVKNITESRLFEKALTRDVDSYVALFGLRAYHSRQDKQVIEQNTTSDGVLNVNLNYPKRKEDGV